MAKFLFVCGTARSGTSAMWKLLTRDTRMVLGLERFAHHLGKGGLQPELFTKQRFLDLQEGDTFYKDLEAFNPYYKTAGDSFDAAHFVGDKIPILFNHLDAVFEAFPDAKVIVMVRNIFDVASSYERRADEGKFWPKARRTSAAIREWRQMLAAATAYADDPRVHLVVYEDFYFNAGAIRGLYKFLGLDLTPKVEQAFAQSLERGAKLEDDRVRGLSQDDIMSICLQAPFKIYRDLVEKIRSKYEKED